jgi:hypothetical protein
MASQIDCIIKPDPQNHHEAITAVGGIRPNGIRFNIPRTQCADDIRLNRETYFVKVGNDKIGVTAYEKNFTWYIKTRPDHTQRDNLLSLGQCR